MSYHNIVLTSQGAATMFLTATLLVSILFYIFFMKMALKLRKSVTKSLNEAAADLINKFLDVKGVSPSSQPGVLKQAAGAVAAGAGMAAGERLLSNGSSPTGSPNSESVAGSEKAVEGDKGTTVAETNNTNNPSGGGNGSGDGESQELESHESNELTAGNDSETNNPDEADARVAQALGDSLDTKADDTMKSVEANNSNLADISSKLDAVQSEQQDDAARDSVRNVKASEDSNTGSTAKGDSDSKPKDVAKTNDAKTDDSANAKKGISANTASQRDVRRANNKEALKKMAMGATLNAMAGDNQFLQGVASAAMVDGFNSLDVGGANAAKQSGDANAKASSESTAQKMHTAGRLQQPQVAQGGVKIQSSGKTLDKVPVKSNTSGVRTLRTNSQSAHQQTQNNTVIVNDTSTKKVNNRIIRKGSQSQSLVNTNNEVIDVLKLSKTSTSKKLNNKKSDNEI